MGVVWIAGVLGTALWSTGLGSTGLGSTGSWSTGGIPCLQAAEGEPEEPARLGRAETVWRDFVKHLYRTDLEGLLPEELRNPKGSIPPDSELDLQGTDPIRGFLFRTSSALIDLDELFQEAELGVTGSGRPEASTPEGAKEVGTVKERANSNQLAPASRLRAQRLVRELSTSKNPYLRVYGDYYSARLDVGEKRFLDAQPKLEQLTRSRRFLPRQEAQRLLAQTYRGLGQPTLALLELQSFLTTLGPGQDSERAWGVEQLRQLSESHPGPLKEAGDDMQSIATLLRERRIGADTRERQRQVEVVLEKIVDLLPKLRQAGKKGRPGEEPKPGEGQPGGGGGRGGGGAGGTSDGPAEDSKLEKGEGYDIALKDATAEEKEAWGRINDREVARSLREVWDKIPSSYRLQVIQYFRDLSDVEASEADTVDAK